jgi:uncharacterized protein YchJ
MSPGDCTIRFALTLQFFWRPDSDLDQEVARLKLGIPVTDFLSDPHRKQKPGRNALCTCGSGRKYKVCCGQRS